MDCRPSFYRLQDLQTMSGVDTSGVERSDVAYVGQANNIELIPIALVRGDSGGWSSGTFYTFVYVSTLTGTYLALSRGFLGSQFTGDGGDDTTHNEQLMTLTWNSSSSTFGLSVVGGNERSFYLKVDDDNSELDWDGDEDDASEFILSTTDPAGYGSGNTLLSGVRYIMSTTDRDSSNILVRITYYDNITDSDDEQYFGLYNVDGSEGSTTIRLSDVMWMFIPYTPYYTNMSSNSFVPSSVPLSLAISQCIYLQGINGYGTSDMCVNWQDYAGFTSSTEYQPVRYFYSDNGQCGNTYTFNGNLLNQSVIVNSSRGNCQSITCNYVGSRFTCGSGSDPDPDPSEPSDPTQPTDPTDPPPTPPPTDPTNPPPTDPTNPPDEDSPDDTDNSGILSRWWFWGLVILVIIIAIAIVVIMFVTSSKKKSP